MKLIFEKSKPGSTTFSIPGKEVPIDRKIPKKYRRKDAPGLPEVSELDVVRHYTNLSKLNFSVDTNFYPLGSCTMKYNPKFIEDIASLEGFKNLHPLIPQLRGGGMLAQGCLEIIYRLDKLLCEITGMAAFTMEPLAGAHGELTGAMLIAAYHKANNNKKTKIIIPDSSHGTNPASASIAGYKVVVIPTDKDGCMDLQKFKENLDEEVAGVMLTCPNTLGVFNHHIKTITDLTHKKNALVYYDGANLNAILGKIRPGDLGFDIVHLNLHKTFATPHGGGGPGAGPIGVTKRLVDFLPIPRIRMRGDGTFGLGYNHPKSIGYVAPFYGNFLVLLKAYSYILLLGKDGLADVADKSVLNANYLKQKLKKHFYLQYDRTCMHEFVLSASNQLKNGVRALDVAKYLIEKGIHPPTVYFPLIVKEALMIEPTETESKDTLDRFIEVMKEIAQLAETDPEILKDSPFNTPVRRLDEALAARNLDLRWTK